MESKLCEILDYKEIEEEKKLWDKKAETIEDDIKLRGSLKNSSVRLRKSIVQIRKFFQKNKNNNYLLDVGCGNGLFTFSVADIFNFVVGVDFSRPIIKRCREKRANVDFVVASATDLPLKNNVFDAILSLSTLQHLRTKQNVEKALKEMSRTATDNSAIFLTFWDTSASSTKIVKELLKKEKYKLQQSLTSKFQFTRLKFTRYVKLKGYRHPTKQNKFINI
ncbi:MAG: class I SAM-dependent methyltransferase [Candidatus Bathyarchaeia archaeon]